MRIAKHPDATLNQLKEWGGFRRTLTTLYPPPLPPDLQEEDPACRRAGHSRRTDQAAEIPGEGAANRGKTAGFCRRDGGQHGDDADPRLGTAGERAKGSVPSSWGSTTVIAA